MKRLFLTLPLVFALAMPGWGAEQQTSSAIIAQRLRQHHVALGVGSLQDGATVLSGSGAAIASTDLIAGIPTPDHDWRFVNNYNDTPGPGKTAINLAAQGAPTITADAFGRANQAVSLPGDNVNYLNVSSSYDDLNDLGGGASNAYAVLFRGIISAGTDRAVGVWNGAVWPIGYSWGLFYNGGVKWSVVDTGNNFNTYAIATTAGSNCQIAVLYDGTTLKIVVNDTVVVNTAAPAVISSVNLATFDVGYQANIVTDRFATWKGQTLTVAQAQNLAAAWHETDQAGVYARFCANPGAFSKTVRGVTTSPSAGTWGAEAPGEYAWQAGVLRYRRAATDPVGNPGNWRQ